MKPVRKVKNKMEHYYPVDKIQAKIKELREGIQEIETPTGKWVLNEASIDIVQSYIDKIFAEILEITTDKSTSHSMIKHKPDAQDRKGDK